MTREQFAQTIRWPWVIWTISIVNPFMTVPQLTKLWLTGQTAGLSFGFLTILFFVQGGFALHGFFTRDKFIMGSNGVAAAMTLITIFSALYLQHLT